MRAGVMLRWFCPCVPFGTLHGILQFLLLFQLLRIAAFAKSGETLGRFAPFVQRLYPDIVLLVPVRFLMDGSLGQGGGVHLPLLRLAQMLRFLHGKVGFAEPQMLRFFSGFVCVQFQLFLFGDRLFCHGLFRRGTGLAAGRFLFEFQLLVTHFCPPSDTSPSFVVMMR